MSEVGSKGQAPEKPAAKPKPGDVTPFVCPLLLELMAQGRLLDAVAVGKEVCVILKENGQVIELWGLQAACRTLFAAHMASIYAAAVTAPSSMQYLDGTARMNDCVVMYDALLETGMLTDAGYSIKAKFQTQPNARGEAATCWRKYMRRRVLTFSRFEDKAMVDALDARWALPLQARIRWLNEMQRLNTIQASIRMTLARKAWAVLPVQRRAAASLMRACMRRRLLMRKLEAFRAACVHLPFNSVINLRSIPRAQREAIRKVVAPPDEGGDGEVNLFAAFLRSTSKLELPEIGEGGGGGVGGAAGRWGMVRQSVGMGSGSVGREGSSEVKGVEAPAQLRSMVREAGSTEKVVGVDAVPVAGMRVVLRQCALDEIPALIEDSGGGAGTITWVDPEDLDGDGITGDICQVLWDKTGTKADYRTGYEEVYRLATLDGVRSLENEEADDDPDTAGRELLVGVDVVPVAGMRVVMRRAALREDPELVADTGGGPGTITWVDPEDLDGDGVTGDICEVLWERSGKKGDYRTGYEGVYRLAQFQGYRSLERAEGEDPEEVVGLDLMPEEGLRVVLRKAALAEFPELLVDSGGGPGTITWVDPEDLDGDGQTGDISEVLWDKTQTKGDYRTGYEGQYRLAKFAGRTMEKESGDAEMVVGVDVQPEEGMRVALRAAALREFPDLIKDSAGGPGTITWVDPEDLDGDGVTGDICAVIWDRTGKKGDYRTGYEGTYRLCKFTGFRTATNKDAHEQVLGLDVSPDEGMRVVLRKAAIKAFPDMLGETGGTPGIIILVDRKDTDGDGQTGDWCEVEWENGSKIKHNTGFEGDFQLAKWFSLADEAAGLSVQRVFRAHRARQLLRRALIAQYLVTREMEKAYVRLSSAILLQNAARNHLSRSRVRFEISRAAALDILPAGAEAHRPVSAAAFASLARSGAASMATSGGQVTLKGAERLALLPTRVQAAVRGHAARMVLRCTLFAMRIVEETNHAEAVRLFKSRTLQAHREFVVRIRHRMLAWLNTTRARRAHREYARKISTRRATGVRFEVYCSLLLFHQEFGKRKGFARMLLQAVYAHLWVRRITANHFARFHMAVSTSLWQQETAALIRARSHFNTQKERARRWRVFTRLSHDARKQGAMQRARTLVRTCARALREWHIASWRRIVVREAGQMMVPFWTSFLVYRVLREWRGQTHRGDLIKTGGRVAMLKLHAAFGPVSKQAQSALARLSNKAVVEKRRKEHGPDAPPEEWRRLAWADRVEAEEIRARDAARIKHETSVRAAAATDLNRDLFAEWAQSGAQATTMEGMRAQAAEDYMHSSSRTGGRGISSRSVLSLHTPTTPGRAGSVQVSGQRDFGGTQSAIARGVDPHAAKRKKPKMLGGGVTVGRTGRMIDVAVPRLPRPDQLIPLTDGGSESKAQRHARREAGHQSFWTQRTNLLISSEARAQKLGDLAMGAMNATWGPGPGGLSHIRQVPAADPGEYILPNIMAEAKKPKDLFGLSSSGRRPGSVETKAETRTRRVAAKQAWMTGGIRHEEEEEEAGAVGFLNRLIGPPAERVDRDRGGTAGSSGSRASLSGAGARSASPWHEARPLEPLAPLAGPRRRAAAR